MSEALEAGELFQGESVHRTSLYPMLVYRRRGSAAGPLLVFAPGGGHLARIAYGHPGSREEDFLAPWLHRSGFDIVAVSYPADHPAICASSQSMTVAQWAQCIAEVAAEIVDEGESNRSRPVVLIGWSMAGRLARAFAVAARGCGLHVQCFISLAATAPFLNLTATCPGGEPLTAANFWDASTRTTQWDAELTAQERLNGRVLIPRDVYERHYRCNNPILLRAEPRELPMPWNLSDVLRDLGSFDYEHYPLCAAVMPTRATDARHALTDRATWSFINSQMIYCDLRTRFGDRLAVLAEARWREIRENVAQLSSTLFREVEGGHFFFLGERGARQTAEHICALIDATARFLRWRDVVCKD